jgi:hypothetical protein
MKDILQDLVSVLRDINGRVYILESDEEGRGNDKYAREQLDAIEAKLEALEVPQ